MTRSADDRGRQAEQPTEVPPRGWKDVLARVRQEAKQDNVPLLSAGMAFYALIALVPALVAVVSVYGLVADPADVERQVRDLLGAAPAEVRQLVQTQLTSIVNDAGAAVGIGVVVGIALAIWSASSGMKHLMEAINAAYDEDETRGFWRLRALSVILTLDAVVFLALAFALIALAPAILADTGLGTAGRVVATVLRFAILGAGLIAALAVLYRYAPDRDEPRWAWVTPGALLAAGLWLAGSLVFSLYTANFGKYNETYGSLGAVVVVMLWLFLTAFVVIIGAELNAELERQTARDTTEGPEAPLGAREARSADTVGPTAEEVKEERARKGASRRA